MEFSAYFPAWKKLTAAQQQLLENNASLRSVPKGTIVHNGNVSCTGPLLVAEGQLRAYRLSEDGREITLYRLFSHDMCLLSAPCMMNSLQFEIIITAEKDTVLWVIPPTLYKKLMEESAPLSNYTNELIIDRFSEVMWLMEQILWKSFDKRLADFLLKESVLEESAVLKITHETIGNHLGNPREVVTRMLRYFQNEGIVNLTRGSIEILNPIRLQEIAQ